MHIFGVVIWMGGLMFQGAVAGPIVQFEGPEARTIMRKINTRFVGFVWMSVWTILVTGVLMMLLSPHFIWFSYPDRWSVYLGLKQIIFVLMVFYSFGYARMLKYITSPASNGGYDTKTDLYLQRLTQFRTINIFLGIVAILLAAGMARA
ncbi:MAG TPA: hypothetical protein VKS81_07890 [Bacteroidota bacterium]|nr:hypothetical protein [Bacteroidota bacterium]